MADLNNIHSIFTIVKTVGNNPDFFKYELKDLVSIGGLFVALVGLFFTRNTIKQNIKQNTISQQWKKTEFIAEEVKSFNENPDVKLVFKMLDWDERNIELFQHEDEYANRIHKFKNQDLVSSLEINFFSQEKHEIQIRDLFDSFFDKLGMFYRYKEAGLFEINEIVVYFKYWNYILCDKKSPKNTTSECLMEIERGKPKTKKRVNIQKQIWVYIKYFQYNDIMNFLTFFGVTSCIEPQIKNYKKLMQEICKDQGINNENKIDNFAYRTFSLDYTKPVDYKQLLSECINALKITNLNATDEEKLKGFTKRLCDESIS